MTRIEDFDFDFYAMSFADGDEFGEFSIGRSDGSLVLARRLLHERRARYSLNVTASDGAATASALVRKTLDCVFYGPNYRICE